MITFILIKLLHLSSWFYFGLIAEYFVGIYVIVAVAWLFMFKIFKLTIDDGCTSLLDVLKAPIATPKKFFVERGQEDGTWYTLALIVVSLLSPLAAIFIFVLLLVMWICKKSIEEKQQI